MTTRRTAFFLLAVGLSLAAARPGSQAAEDDAAGAAAGGDAAAFTLDVHALANEGFLLRAGDDAVLIDAFVIRPHSVYGWLRGEARKRLEDGAEPFAGVDLALVSHRHRDHFQPEPARQFLASNPDCVLATSPQVLDDLWKEPAADEGTEASEEAAHEAAEIDRTKVRDVLPEPGEERRLEVGGITVDVLRLSHGSTRFARIQNLAHVITLGGVTALHIGDAAMEPANFEPYRLASRGIDVVFVPYWYFEDANGRAIIEEHFRPARLIACHIPPTELRAVTTRLSAFPDVIVPQSPLELVQIQNTR